jgi:DNA-binding transcriptional MerR regulator
MLRFNTTEVLILDHDLISKKELLELTGISYGQLYRWKRKNLIPEDWFIRKSTFTGQETFFPRDDILARIDKIKDMKDDLSLDQLADVFSPIPAATTMTRENFMKRNIVSISTVELDDRLFGRPSEYAYERMLRLYVLNRLLSGGDILIEEGKSLLQVLAQHLPAFLGKSCELLLIRKMGVSLFVLTVRTDDLAFDAEARIVLRLPLQECIGALNMKLGWES